VDRQREGPSNPSKVSFLLVEERSPINLGEVKSLTGLTLQTGNSPSKYFRRVVHFRRSLSTSSSDIPAIRIIRRNKPQPQAEINCATSCATVRSRSVGGYQTNWHGLQRGYQAPSLREWKKTPRYALMTSSEGGVDCNLCHLWRFSGSRFSTSSLCETTSGARLMLRSTCWLCHSKNGYLDRGYVRGIDVTSYCVGCVAWKPP
jgi:hypothetical protein